MVRKLWSLAACMAVGLAAVALIPHPAFGPLVGVGAVLILASLLRKD